MEQKNLFHGGLDRDTSNSLKSPDRYVFMENGDVIYDESNGTGIITNTKGNAELGIVWPSDVDTGVFPYTEDAKDPYGVSWLLIGTIYLREDIILFYSLEGGAGESRIDLLKYNGDGTYTRIRLVIDQLLNFVFDNKIHGIARYENESVIKCYFGEKNKEGGVVNNVRHFNLAPDIVGKVVADGFLQGSYTKVNGLTASEFELLKEGATYQPNFLGYEGGTLRVGVVQYSIREAYKNGAKGTWSPFSYTIPLTKASLIDIENSEGDDTTGEDLSSGKSVKLQLYHDSCDYLEVARLWYSNINEDPEVILTARIETGTTSSGIITYIDDEYESPYGSIDISEFIDNPFLFKAKTIVSKDNRLFVGNITQDFFDLDFDARAYRFSQAQVAKIKDASLGEVAIDGVTPDWNIDETHDAINETNDLTLDVSATRAYDSIDPVLYIVNVATTMTVNEYAGYVFVNRTDGEEIGIVSNTANSFQLKVFTGWTAAGTYKLRPDFKYKADGSTLGAEGSNVSIEIILEESIIDTGTRRSIEAPLDAWLSGRYKRFQADEIYRFGVVFFDSYGRRSPVKWCCDLRMPSVHEFGLVRVDGGNTYAKHAVPRFTVTKTGTEAAGLKHQIVYVKRERKDRTIEAQGIISGTQLGFINGTHITPEYDNMYYPACSMSESNMSTQVLLQTDKMNGSMNFINESVIKEFNSPEISMNKRIDNSISIIDYLGYFEGTSAHGIYKSETGYDFAGVYNSNAGATITSLSLSGKVSNFVSVLRGDQGDITEAKVIESRQVVMVDGYIVNGLAHTANPPSVAGSPWSRSIKGTFLAVSCPALIVNHSVDNFKIGLVNLKKHVVQYGGDKYLDRLNNIYIPASLLISGSTENAHYGDTFLQFFDVQRTIWRNEEETALESSPTYGSIPYNASESFIFPVETSINLTMRQDNYYSKEYKAGPDPTDQYASQVRDEGLLIAERQADPTDAAPVYDVVVNYSSLYKYNSVYSRVDDVFISAPSIDLFNNTKLDSTVIYSDFKLNGELFDNWLKFKVNNAKEVDTAYGSINWMVNKNNTVVVFQDSGISIAQINPQVQIPSGDGSSLILGTGGVLERFNYISTSIGIQKINEAIESNSGLYWIDINKKKLYVMYGGDIQSLSDTKNMHSYFSKVLNENTDLVGVYDNKRSAVLLSIRNEVGGTLFDDVYFSVTQASPSLIISGDTTNTVMKEGLLYGLVNTAGDVGYHTLDTITATTLEFTYSSGEAFLLGDTLDLRKYIDIRESFTILFSEKGNYFVTLESFIPSRYIKGVREFYSSEDNRKLYEHNIGVRGSYYGTVYPTTLEFIVNSPAGINKILGAFEVQAEVLLEGRDSEDAYDFIGVENESLNQVRVVGSGRQSEYIDLYLKNAVMGTEVIGTQSTGNIDPATYVGSNKVLQDTNGVKIIPYPAYLYNSRKSLNKTRFLSPRIKTDITDSNGRDITENVRGNYFLVRLVFNNNQDKLLKLYEVISYINSSIEL